MAYDRTPLSPEELQRFLAEHPAWRVEQGMIARTYSFDSFPRAIEFVQQVADAAEAQDHHPDIDIRWRKATLRLITHAAKALTFRDPKLAEECDRIFDALERGASKHT